jgi:hypothetical protein
VAHLHSPYDEDDRRTLPFIGRGLVVIAGGDQPPTWVAIAPHGSLRANGEPVVTGIRVLRHGDEIQCPPLEPLVFCDEHVSRVEPLPQLDTPVRCARCTGDITRDTPAVRCPACGHWCHEHGEFTCWTATTQCPVCGQSTVLAGDATPTAERR